MKKNEKGKSEKEKKVISKFKVVLPNEEIKELEEIDLEKRENVRSVIQEEVGKGEEKEGSPAHIELAKKLEIAEHEPVSDAGCLRFYPKGTFIKELLHQWSWKKFVEDFGAYPIKTPAIISMRDEGVQWLVKYFIERTYGVRGGNENDTDLFLRPGGDYGSFSLHRDAYMSYKQLPVALYENEMDYRYEQQGEVRGLYRLREFEMHNLHVVCKDKPSALDVFWNLFHNHLDLFEHAFEIDAFIFYCEKGLLSDYKAELKDLAAKFETPIIVELLKTVRVYMGAWIDALVFDSLGRPMEIGTSQIDFKSAREWNITYIDDQGEEQFAPIVHAGFGPDRYIAAMLEYCARHDQPYFPIGLSPIQVRIIPVSNEYLPYAKQLSKELEEAHIRVDIDEREESVGKRIRQGEVEWIPYLIVVGEKEVEGDTLPVRMKETGTVKQMTRSELKEMIQEKSQNIPFVGRPTPRKVSKTLSFRGGLS